MINVPPFKAPVPVDIFLKPGTSEQSKIAQVVCSAASDAPCSIAVHVGLFFDGTNNNLERDRNGLRTGVIDEKTKVPIAIAKIPLKPEDASHSNVARLFLTYPNGKQQSGYFSNYIPGVGTPFKERGEYGQMGAGLANICCASIPRVWYPGMKVLVRWDMPEEHTHIVKEKMVEVEKYDRPGDIYMHFFENDEVRVVVSNAGGPSKIHPILHSGKPATIP